MAATMNMDMKTTFQITKVIFWSCVAVTFASFGINEDSKCRPLNQFVLCYEIVSPNITMVTGIDSNNVTYTEKRVEFQAFGRDFRLRLRPVPDDFPVLPATAVIRLYSENSVKTYRRDQLGLNLYIGFDASEVALSHVQVMFIDDDAFQGVVLTTGGNAFYIEPVADYLQGSANQGSVLVYRRQDLNSSYHPPNDNWSACSRRFVRHTSSNASATDQQTHHRSNRGRIVEDDHDKAEHEKETDDAKSTLSGANCRLCIIVDHTYFTNIAKLSKATAVGKAAMHVAEADFIFRGTDFNDNGLYDNIGFTVGEMRIYMTPLAADYFMRDTTVDRNHLHQQLTKYNFDEFCLAVAFTFRDFGEGVIGQSFVPSLRTEADEGHIGGICERYHSITGSADLPPGRYSLNALIISQMTAGERLVDAVMALTLAHEVGHSFGANHDEDYTGHSCVPGPGSIHGNYLMSRHVSKQPNQAHNWMFSACSRKAMAQIIRARGECIRRRQTPYCGNAVIEKGEECDCGTQYSCEFVDRCCVPAELATYWTPVKPGPCRLSAACSPRASLCCVADCSVSRADTVCRPETDCTKQSLCSGSSPSCPLPVLGRENSSCGGGRGTCLRGVCSVSVCELNGLKACRCGSPLLHRCSVCCQCATGKSACVPAEWLALERGRSALRLPPATPCTGGVCNADGLCEAAAKPEETAAMLSDHVVGERDYDRAFDGVREFDGRH